MGVRKHAASRFPVPINVRHVVQWHIQRGAQPAQKANSNLLSYVYLVQQNSKVMMGGAGRVN